MTATEMTRAKDSPGGGFAIRNYLGDRRGQIAAGAVIAIAGLAFNWTWLVAVGVVPLLLSVLPCVAMCALGLCMNRMTGRACSTENVVPKADGESDGAKAVPINPKDNR
ncbi:hypothetical protein EN978_34160 [Mesorhizobium sp. M7A.F.Ca.US.001.04.1.1]|uniref:hypothetical protein n=1 Tax=unclassified Mesorhizobium TaxID=325217 RepID=UPI000FCC13C7|nr:MULTISPECIES: hypothetical protein [unclassified Mesorhizobium]RUY28051.1 hypothetical protein EN979_14720 [Mesorhizobium sp. M7A.F.Ca.US.001.04.2.1]RUY34694.1 hypothetical protein EN978_34160 [Mesorhizobium sp. M7A.F.Ca.US.001.04.1.1]